MEIEIDSKRNNPLLNRTEIYFTIKHEGESTPNRELIKSELADKLNVKKENIIVNTIDSSFGKQEISGYAKIYSSIATAKDIETEHILQRNKLIEGAKKPDKKVEAPPVKKGEAEVKPAKEELEAKPEVEPKEEPKGEAPKEEVAAPPEAVKDESKDKEPPEKIESPSKTPIDEKIEPTEQKEEEKQIPKDEKSDEKPKEKPKAEEQSKKDKKD